MRTCWVCDPVSGPRLSQIALARVRGQEVHDLLPARARELGQAAGAVQPAAVRDHPAHDERHHLGRVHAEDVVDGRLEGDVVAEPAGLLGRVGMTVRVDHQTEVVGRLPLTLGRTREVGQPQRDRGLPHAVRERLAQAEIGGIRQRRDQLGDPDAAGLRDGASAPLRTGHGPESTAAPAGHRRSRWVKRLMRDPPTHSYGGDTGSSTAVFTGFPAEERQS